MGYRVWSCKIVVAEGAALPDGADRPPRTAAIVAVEMLDVGPVVACFSGWAGTLTESEAEYLEAKALRS